MKLLPICMLVALLFFGCSKNNPVSSTADNSSSAQSTALFGASTMYNTITATVLGTSSVADSGGIVHDSCVILLCWIP